MKFFEFLLQQYIKYKYRIPGLLIGYVLIFVFISYIDADINKLITNKFIKFGLYVLCLILWFFTWLSIKNYFPSTSKDKIGIIIIINAENEKQKVRIKYDFTERLKKALTENNLLNLFEILILNDYRADLAQKIIIEYTHKNNEIKKQIQQNIEIESKPKEIKNWEKFQKKIGGHFFIYGNIVERLDSENKYFLNIDGLAVHEPTSINTSNELTNDFKSIFPKEISFFEKFERLGFQFTADTMYLCIRYITGFAALISHDPITALKLHNGLKDQIKKFASPLPPYLRNILNKLDELISSEKFLIAQYYYLLKNDITKAKQLIEDCLNIGVNLYDPLILKSFILFKEDRNVFDSIKTLNLASKNANENYTWLYNKAFIFMYIGKFTQAINCYRILSNISFKEEEFIVNQCLAFNLEIFQNEPDKIQCYFILGYLNWKKKLNFPVALENFESFIEKAKPKKDYKYLLNIAINHLQSIESKMSLK